MSSSESYQEYDMPPAPADYGIGEEIDTIVLPAATTETETVVDETEGSTAEPEPQPLTVRPNHHHF